uniref:Choline phosphotransferase 1 n=1 Tax=Felis catus TaxID=9685 RepID=A0ABI7ZZA0_FELCA
RNQPLTAQLARSFSSRERPDILGEESNFRGRCISPLGKSGPLHANQKVTVGGTLVVTWWPARAGPTLPDTSPDSPQPLPQVLSPEAPPSLHPRGRTSGRAALGAGAPGPEAAPPDLDLGRASPTGESHPAATGPGPQAPPFTSPRPGAGHGPRSLEAAGPAGGHGGGRRGQAGAALAEGAGGAAERGAAAAAGGAPLQRGGRLAARAAAAGLLDLAAPVDPAVDGSQLHHPPGPGHQPAHHARAYLLLPHGHRGVFMAVGASVAVRLGTHPDWLFFCSFIGMFMFYCAHWQTYVSGVLRFGKVDVTEIQVALVIVFILSTLGGATMWDYTIPILEIKLKIFPVLGVVGGAIFSCSNYFNVILHGGVGKNGSTIAGTSVLSPGLHIGIIIILAIMIYKKSATNVFEKHPCLYTLMFGCVFAKVSQKLVIAHMTKSELYLQDTVFFGPGLLFLDQYFNNFIDEYVVLWIAMVSSFLLRFLFILTRCQITLCLRVISVR